MIELNTISSNPAARKSAIRVGRGAGKKVKHVVVVIKVKNLDQVDFIR